jgi:hypothetical protein
VRTPDADQYEARTAPGRTPKPQIHDHTGPWVAVADVRVTPDLGLPWRTSALVQPVPLAPPDPSDLEEDS